MEHLESGSDNLGDRKLDEKTLGAYFEHAGAATFIMEKDMIISKCNHQFEVLSGYTKREIEGKVKGLIFSHPDDRALHEKYHDNRRKSGSAPNNYETRFVDKYGNLKNVAVTIGLIPGTEKSIVSMINITDWMKTEKALRENEKRYRVLFEDSPISLWELETTSVRLYIDNLVATGVKDFSSHFKNHPEDVAKCMDMVKVVDVNKVTLALYEASSKEELLGKGLSKVLTEESHDVFIDILVALIEGKTSFEDEAVNKTLTGTKKHVAMRCSVIPDPEKIISKILVSVVDITERKQAEEALKESEEKYRSFVYNFQGIAHRSLLETWTPIFFHGAVEEITGYTADEFKAGKPRWDEIIHPEDFSKIRETFEKILLYPGYSTEREYRIIHKDGQFRWVLDIIQNIRDKSGGITMAQGVIYDITSRKLAEEALRESENKHRMLFESSPDGILIADIQTKEFKYANPAICSMLGYEEEELKKFKVNDIHPKEVLAFVLSDFEEQVRGKGETLTRNVPCLKKDGTIIFVDINNAPVVMDGRECNLGFFRDMTNYEHAEKLLRESEERYRRLVELSPDAITVTDLDMSIIMVNKHNVKNLGYKHEGELIGRNAMDIIVPEEHEKALEYAKRTMEYGTMRNLEYTMFKKDGSRIQVDMNTALIRDDEGNPKAFMAVGRDVTKRKLMAKELQHRFEMEKLVSSISTNFINLAPADINEGINKTLEKIGKFADVDRSYVFLFDEKGIKADNTHEWCAEGITSRLDALKNLDLEQYKWAMGKLLKGEIIYIPRFEDLPKESEKLREALIQTGGITSFIVVPMISGKSLVGALGFDTVQSEKIWSDEDIAILKMVGDIFVIASERKRVVEELQDQKEETSLLLDIIAHDLGNYFGAIKGFIDLSLNKSPPEITDTIGTYLNKSRAGIERARSLLGNVSILMKQSITTSYNLQPVNVPMAINNAERTLYSLFPFRNIVINKDSEEPGCSILSDTLFEQLVVNLLTNAVKYDAQDPVKLEISSKCLNDSKTCLITITDHGRGIPVEEREGIFERFIVFRKKGKGSGLGLFIVKTLVERYKGKVWIESRIEDDYTKGTRIHVELPTI
ncbi:MAG: PAS domain S-box protein [Candidatus Hodarchaeales archaeon]